MGSPAKNNPKNLNLSYKNLLWLIVVITVFKPMDVHIKQELLQLGKSKKKKKKKIFFLCQGKVREFCAWSAKFGKDLKNRLIKQGI